MRCVGGTQGSLSVDGQARKNSRMRVYAEEEEESISVLCLYHTWLDGILLQGQGSQTAPLVE